VGEGGVPIDRGEVVAARAADERTGEAVGRADGRAELGGLGAEAAEVGGGRLDAADAQCPARRALKAQPAADAAVRADRLAEQGNGDSGFGLRSIVAQY